jgi:hypothetical protein
MRGPVSRVRVPGGRLSGRYQQSYGARPSRGPGGCGGEDDARDFLEEAPRDLTERDEVLAVHRGGIFVFVTRNNTRPHKDILQAWEAEWNSPRRWGLFGSKLWEGAEVIVIRKLPNSELMAFRSSAYCGKKEPASENAIRAAKVHFRAVSPNEEVIREPIATNKTRIRITRPLT